MLVLSRRKGQVITIGDDIELVLIDSNNERARIGIRAPMHVPIHRREIYDEIKRGEGQGLPDVLDQSPMETPEGS